MRGSIPLTDVNVFMLQLHTRLAHMCVLQLPSVFFILDPLPPEQREAVLHPVNDVCDNGKDDEEDNDDNGNDDVAPDHCARNGSCDPDGREMWRCVLSWSPCLRELVFRWRIDGFVWF